MKIVHIFRNYYPVIGGVEKVVQHLAEEQAKLGHEVIVITSNIGVSDKPKEEVNNRVKVIRLRAMKPLYDDLTIPLEGSRIKDIDIVHVPSQDTLFSIILAERLKLKLGVRIAVHFMGIDTLNTHPNSLVRTLGPHYQQWITKKAIKLSDIKLARSLRDKNVLEERYDVSQVYHLPDGVPAYYFTMREKPCGEFNEKFKIRQENFFLFIGRIHKFKGPHILVRAMKYIDRDVRVVFIGPDGGYTKKTLDLAKRLKIYNKVYVLGYVDEKTKIHALDSAIALVLPSITDHAEVYPMVISEAWARKKPVIASKVGGIPYMVKDNVNGMLVEPSNPRLLAKAMLEILDNEKLSKRMGMKGRENVSSWYEMAMKSLELYKLAKNQRSN